MKGSLTIRALTCVIFSTAVVVTMSLSADPVWAHALLVKAEPPRRAVLAKPPAQVQLWFNEEIEGDYASLAVCDRYGYLRGRWTPESDGADWTDMDLVMQQIEQLKREKEILPPPDDHVH